MPFRRSGGRGQEVKAYMRTAQDVSEKLIALRAWLSEARQELERQMDREATAVGPSEDARRHWCSMAIGQLALLYDAAGAVLSTVDVAYDVGFSAPARDSIGRQIGCS